MTLDGESQDNKAPRKTAISQRAMCVILVLVLTVIVLVAILIFLVVEHRHKEQDVCLSPACIRAATKVLDAVDFSKNPCENFYEFACGNWMKKNIVPEESSYYATFTKMREEVHVKLKALLETNVTTDDVEAVVKAKHLYQSCINTELIDKRDISVIYPVLDKLGRFPMLQNSTGGNWSSEKSNLNKLLASLQEYSNDPIVQLYASEDQKQTNRTVIYIDQGGLFLPSREYYISKDKNVTSELENILTKMAVLFGVDENVARRQVYDVVKFEIDFAKILTPRESRIDNEQLYNPYTLGELNDQFNTSTKHNFDLEGFMKKTFAMKGVEISLDEDTSVIVRDRNFMSQVGALLDQHSTRTVTNYVILRFLRNRCSYLPQRFQDLVLDLIKLTKGVSVAKPTWRKCTQTVRSFFGLTVGRMFIKDNFLPEAKQGMSSMIKYVKEAFSELLNELDWMDDETVAVAKEKIKQMGENIGYDPDLLDDDILNRRYENITVSPELYMENILGLLNEIALRNLRQLKEKPFELSWESSPTTVNAFYSPSTNKIMFPAGILQQPHFHVDQPWSLNFGGIGTLVGHEITHGFDNSGRQFDKDGKLVQWWNDEAINKFETKTGCFKNQYGNFRVPEAGNLPMNGITTLGENIADNGGIKQSFRGYQKWLEDNGGKDKILPGVNLTNEQLFFLGYAQIRCFNIRRQDAIDDILTGVHSPPRFRVIGALQNSKDFPRVYGCPPGSFMNPEKKCHVW